MTRSALLCEYLLLGLVSAFLCWCLETCDLAARELPPSGGTRAGGECDAAQAPESCGGHAQDEGGGVDGGFDYESLDGATGFPPGRDGGAAVSAPVNLNAGLYAYYYDAAGVTESALPGVTPAEGDDTDEIALPPGSSPAPTQGEEEQQESGGTKGEARPGAREPPAANMPQAPPVPGPALPPPRMEPEGRRPPRSGEGAPRGGPAPAPSRRRGSGRFGAPGVPAPLEPECWSEWSGLRASWLGEIAGGTLGVLLPGAAPGTNFF